MDGERGGAGSAMTSLEGVSSRPEGLTESRPVIGALSVQIDGGGCGRGGWGGNNVRFQIDLHRSLTHAKNCTKERGSDCVFAFSLQSEISRGISLAGYLTPSRFKQPLASFDD